MSESLSWRVKRLISGSVNDLVDSLENANSETVMREAIREIDRTVDDVRSELGKVMATRNQTVRYLERTQAKAAEMTEKASFAVEQQRDDLAEAAIARQIDLEKQVPALQKQIEDLGGKQRELEDYVAALNGRKSEMEADLAAFVEAREMASAEAFNPDAPTGAVNDTARRVEQAQSAFDRAHKGGSKVAGQPRYDRETVAKLNELESVSRSTAIADRLAAMKAARKAS